MTTADVRPAINASVLMLYRIFAIVTLYAVLAGVLVYAIGAGFYAVNSTWVAPVILAPEDRDTLDLTEKLATTRLTVGDLLVDQDKMRRGIAEMTKHRAELLALKPKIQDAIIRERQHNDASGIELFALSEQKKVDNARTRQMLGQISEISHKIDADLQAGLITKADAAVSKVALNQNEVAFTDSRIAENLLKDTVLQKSTLDTKSLDTLTKQAELVSEIAQLDAAISVAEKQLAAESEQIDQLNKAISVAQSTPYYLAITRHKKVNFAFLPYDNQSHADIGTPVFDCALNFVWCRQVGIVKQVFGSEEHAVHPIFRTDLRGKMIEIEFDASGIESAKSKTLFLGKAPVML